MPRLAGAAAATLLLLVGWVWASTTPTLSAWTSARLGNQANSVATASLDFTHSAGPCSASLTTTATVACGGSVVGTDRVTNNGTAPAAALSRTVSAASCATVRLDNRATPANVMLPRYSTRFRQPDPFGGANAITLDGASYAAAIATHQVPITNGVTYGVGIWFRAAAGQSGPLVSLAGSPANTPGGDDRTLALNANGTLSFAFNSLGAKVTSTASYADGAWHFAYVTMTGTFLGLSNTTTITVDGAVAATQTGLLSYTSTTGYWHAGWGSTALTGGSTAYFTGSLSNMVVFNGNAPVAPTAAQRASQAAFTTWAASANDHWLLADTGTTTYTGTQPSIGTTSPCSMLTIAWSFTNPSATVSGPSSLAAFADGTARTVSASPGPGTTQVGTVAIGRASGYNAYVTGLRLRVPVTEVVRVGSSSWALTFAWQSEDAVVIA